jgi:hypothetical protein
MKICIHVIIICKGSACYPVPSLNIKPNREDYEELFLYLNRLFFLYQPVAKPYILEDQGFYSGLPSLGEVAYHG